MGIANLEQEEGVGIINNPTTIKLNENVAIPQNKKYWA